MAKIHGRRAHVSITDSGGVARDLSSFCNNIDLPGQLDVAETTPFNVQDKTFVAGLRSHTLKIGGQWDDTATTGPDDVLATLLGQGAAGTIATTFIVGPAGSAAGNVKYTGACILTAYQRTAPVGGIVTFGADFQVSGSVQRTTY